MISGRLVSSLCGSYYVIRDGQLTEYHTTTQAAHAAGIDPRSFARWARNRGVEPAGRVRVGRSYVTLWSLESLTDAT